MTIEKSANTLRMASAVLVLVLLTSCGSTKSYRTQELSLNKATTADHARYSQVVTAVSVIEEAQTFYDHDITVTGVVDSVTYKDLPKGLGLLVVELHTPEQTIELVPAAAQTIAELDIGPRLNKVSGWLLDAASAAGTMDVDREKCSDMYYDLMAAGSRVRALSHYFTANEMVNVADSVRLPAEGYQDIASAYKAFAELRHSAEDEVIGPTTLESVPVPNLDLPETAAQFEVLVMNAGNELLSIANDLIDNREALAKQSLRLNVTDLDLKAGYTLMTAGDMYRADAWRLEKEKRPNDAKNGRAAGLAFVSMGKGVAATESGLSKFSAAINRRLPVANTTPTAKTVPVRSLKCAAIGYNRDVLRDAADKLKLVGRFPVHAKGRLLFGNLREEVNQVWLDTAFVDIDGLQIDLEHKDDSSSKRQVGGFYEFIEELDE